MRVAAPLRMVHSPGVLPPAAKPGRTPRRSATARACRPALRRPRRARAGRTLTVYDTAGQGVTYGLDSAKRVTSVAQSAPNITGTRTVTYELDKAGNKTRAIWPDSYYVSYQFDDINRMTTVTENGTFVLATYVWDPLSRRASLAFGNGTTQSYSYSKAGDLETHTHTITGNSNTWTNSFTKAHQLLSEAASNAAWVFQPAVNETTSYGSANNLNQYITVTHAANPMATLYYDGNGNLIDDGAWDFEYDAENRLTKAANVTTGTTAQYLYDPMGRRQAKVVGSVTTSFLSDGAEEIAEYDGAGGLLRRYIPGPGTDQPIAMVTPSGGSHLHSYFHTNRQGSTVAMSNDAGTVSEGPYTYDAYGQGAPSTGVPFKYTGRRLDPDTGLYYYRARYYSAALGRFLQTDPIGYADQMNLYGYVHNDPGNATDPSGKCGPATPLCLAALRCSVSLPCREAAKAAVTGVAATIAAVYIWVTSDEKEAPSESEGAKESPPVPGQIVGEGSRKGSGGRFVSGPLAPENGGTGDADEDFDKLTGGNSRPATEKDGRPPGTQIGDNGIQIRPASNGEGPKIDIPGTATKPPETLHYPPPPPPPPGETR